jgi:uncharacterized membrane protein
MNGIQTKHLLHSMFYNGMVKNEMIWYTIYDSITTVLIPWEFK